MTEFLVLGWPPVTRNTVLKCLISACFDTNWRGTQNLHTSMYPVEANIIVTMCKKKPPPPPRVHSTCGDPSPVAVQQVSPPLFLRKGSFFLSPSIIRCNDTSIFQQHVELQAQKLKMKMGFWHWSRAYFCLEDWKMIVHSRVMSVHDAPTLNNLMQFIVVLRVLTQDHHLLNFNMSGSGSQWETRLNKGDIHRVGVFQGSRESWMFYRL